jgi:hypothetical protein
MVYFLLFIPKTHEHVDLNDSAGINRLQPGWRGEPRAQVVLQGFSLLDGSLLPAGVGIGGHAQLLLMHWRRCGALARLNPA